MNLFNFFIKKAEETPTEIKGAIETWVVSWNSVYRYVGNSYDVNSNYQSFTTKASAQEYANELKMARKLLGDKDLGVYVEKQTPPTNV